MSLSPPRPAHRFDEKSLTDYLSERLDDFSPPVVVRQFDAGQSNPTFSLETHKHRYVLRKKPPGTLLPKAHMVEREYRVMKALADTEVPVPRVLLLCEDPAVVGTPFFIMEHLEGRVLWDARLPGLPVAERGGVHREMIRVLAALHRLDYEALGLSDYGKPGNYFERQLSRWTRQYRAAETETIETMEQLIEWLPANIPGDDTTCLVHGDYRLDNLIFHAREPRVLGVVDWELSTLGHPLADLAYTCQVYHVSTHHPPIRSGAGIPTEQEAIAQYREWTGRGEIEDWPFYLAFSMFRLAGIVQGVYKRGLDGNASSTRALEMGKFVRVLGDTAWDLVH